MKRNQAVSFDLPTALISSTRRIITAAKLPESTGNLRLQCDAAEAGLCGLYSGDILINIFQDRSVGIMIERIHAGSADAAVLKQ